MMRRLHTLIRLGYTLALLLTVITVDTLAQESKENVGVILPLSGASAFIGENLRRGMELSLLSEDKFSLVFEDNGGANKDSVTAYQKLIALQRPSLVIAATAGAEALAPISERNSIPLLLTVSSSSNVTKDRKWVFRYFTNADVDAVVMARFVGANKTYKRIAILHVEEQFGFDYATVFRREFESSGGTVSASSSFSYIESDYKIQLLKLKSTSPDGIYLIGLDYQIISILKQMKQLGMRVPIFAIGTVATHDSIEKAEGLLENVYVTAFCTDGPSEDFQSKYDQKYHSKAGFFAEIGYDLITLLRNAAMRKGNSPKGLQEGLASIRNIELNTGTVSIGNGGELTIPICIKQIIRGRIKNLETGRFSDY